MRRNDPVRGKRLAAYGGMGQPHFMKIYLELTETGYGAGVLTQKPPISSLGFSPWSIGSENNLAHRAAIQAPKGTLTARFSTFGTTSLVSACSDLQRQATPFIAISHLFQPLGNPAAHRLSRNPPQNARANCRHRLAPRLSPSYRPPQDSKSDEKAH